MSESPNDLVDCVYCKGSGKMFRAVAEVHSDPEAMASIRRGLEDVKAGRMVPWATLKRIGEEEPTSGTD